jgi:RNase_H superfamily
MNRRYLAFDIETTTVQTASERDSRVARPPEILCAATLPGDADEPLLWYSGVNSHPAARMKRDDVRRLVDYLSKCARSGYTLLTWNGVGFDFAILAEVSGKLTTCRRLATTHVDMMFHVMCQLGYGVSLDSAAKGMNLRGKYGGLSGAQVPTLWAQGKRKRVLEYVAQDVRIALSLAKTCEACGYLRWITRSNKRREMRLPKGLLAVELAQKLPERATPWMFNEWSRRRFTAWLHQ